MLNIDIFEDKSPKKKIFNILVSKGQLSAKEIHNILKKQFSINHSYQATYKLLQNMVETKVIEKTNLKYTINEQWIRKQRDILESIVTSVQDTTNCIYSSDFIRIYKLYSLDKVDEFIQKTVLQINKKYQFNTTFWKSPHCWWLLTNPLNEDAVVGDYVDRDLKSYALITSDTRLDKIAKKYYDSKHESYEQCLIEDKSNTEIVQVIGNYTILFEIPEEILEELNAIYELTETSEILSTILELISRKHAFDVKVIKDSKIAETYQKEICPN